MLRTCNYSVYINSCFIYKYAGAFTKACRGTTSAIAISLLKLGVPVSIHALEAVCSRGNIELFRLFMSQGLLTDEPQKVLNAIVFKCLFFNSSCI